MLVSDNPAGSFADTDEQFLHGRRSPVTPFRRGGDGQPGPVRARRLPQCWPTRRRWAALDDLLDLPIVGDVRDGHYGIELVDPETGPSSRRRRYLLRSFCRTDRRTAVVPG